MSLDKMCTEIARELRLDRELVKRIVTYEFKFTTDVMKDPDDYHDILFSKLFRFSLKPRFKDNKTKKYNVK